MIQRCSSTAHALAIGTVHLSEGGAIGMTLCPGRRESGAPGGQRDLRADLDAIRDWGATTVVTLNQNHELDSLGVPALGDVVQAAGMAWLHLPIGDMAAPDRPWEMRWREIGPEVHRKLDAAEGVVFHCGGGSGRAGTITALTLIERGDTPDDAIAAVRAARPGAIESPDQERYLLSLSGHARDGVGEV